MTVIDYYFALISPWSFMGSARLSALAKTHSATVNVIPAKLGEIYAQTGGIPLPERAPQRQAYRMAELKRWAAFLDIPLVFEPKFFPSDETENVRLVLGAAKLGQDALALVTEFGRTLWQLDQDPNDPDAQARAATRAGLDIEALRTAMTQEEADAIWTKNTQQAVANGVFGAPSYVIDGEIFWGQDRLDFVERKLAG